VEYKRLVGAYPLRDLQKICKLCTSFQEALGFKILLDLLKGLCSYGSFKLRGPVTPKSSAPPSAKPMCETPKVFEVQECARGPLSPCQVRLGSDFSKSVEFFVCLFVCPSRF